MKSYWPVQIGVCALFGVALPVIGWFFLTDSEEPGRGLILILCGFLFLACLVWLIRAYRRMSSTQRAIYAWAVGQLSEAPIDDLEKLRIANLAQAGTLAPDDLQRLKDWKPSQPHPGA